MLVTYRIESTSNWLRLINLSAKRAGERSAGNLHAPFDVAGDGNQLTVRLVRHSQRKRGAPDRSDLRSMAPFLDPTRRRLAWCIRRCTNDAAASLGGKHGQGLPRRDLVLTEVRTVRSSYEASRCFKAVRVPGFALTLRQTPFSSYDSLSTWTFLRMSAS